jgi:hypothetical protein
LRCGVDPAALAALIKQAGAGAGAAAGDDSDDDIPELVENFDDAAKK